MKMNAGKSVEDKNIILLSAKRSQGNRMRIKVTAIDNGYWRLGIAHNRVLDVYQGIGSETATNGDVWVRVPDKRIGGFIKLPAKDFEVVEE